MSLPFTIKYTEDGSSYISGSSKTHFNIANSVTFSTPKGADEPNEAIITTSRVHTTSGSHQGISYSAHRLHELKLDREGIAPALLHLMKAANEMGRTIKTLDLSEEGQNMLIEAYQNSKTSPALDSQENIGWLQDFTAE